MKKLSIFVLSTALLLLPRTGHSDTGFTIDLGVGYDLWFKDFGPGKPSAITYGGAAGAAFGERLSVTGSVFQHEWKEAWLDMVNTFIDFSGRYILTSPEASVRLYAGAGVTLLLSDLQATRPDPIFGKVFPRETGTAFGLKGLAGIEVGGSEYMGFLEAGYRLMTSSPLPNAEGSDFNNVPVVVGLRMRFD